MSIDLQLLLLHTKISAVCPIDGISISDPNNPVMWRIDFAVGATKQQMAQAQAALAAISPAQLTAADATVQTAAAAIPDPLAAAKARAISSLPTAPVLPALPATPG